MSLNKASADNEEYDFSFPKTMVKEMNTVQLIILITHFIKTQGTKFYYPLSPNILF